MFQGSVGISEILLFGFCHVVNLNGNGCHEFLGTKTSTMVPKKNTTYSTFFAAEKEQHFKHPGTLNSNLFNGCLVQQSFLRQWFGIIALKQLFKKLAVWSSGFFFEMFNLSVGIGGVFGLEFWVLNLCNVYLEPEKKTDLIAVGSLVGGSFSWRYDTL